ncbi:uncharacterized protein LOC124356672 [Homalodisca vitripennis]|uniref:uncharacterized protein LOC124356672 n=1 Tax=Homalodisca vitripennis TaxID=197043 RepID=UPI001EEAA78E|nr:uncharacterized protein LOC124356672 [Homalodisca vitripennis]XP_046663762.1 uncharacterized protein LOC124356672 [Homalodisca vitripennis]
MATNTPEWLTGDFLKSCLEDTEGNVAGVIITSYTLEPAIAPGNNYGSQMIRANVQYKRLDDSSTEESISLIIKAPLSEDSYIGDQFGDNFKQFYESESNYYHKFISETYRLSKHDVVPKHYKSPNPLCVVLEDLKASGFEMADRQKLLDFDHCELFIKASAKLHALSMAIFKKDPGLIESLGVESPAMAEKMEKSFKLMLPNSLLCMATYLEDKPDYKKQFEIIKEACEEDVFWNIYKEMLEDCKSKPIRALTQGDPWCTNMMFKYNSAGKVTDIKIIDFQNVRLCSPLVELVFFLTASANLEVRQKRLNDLYQIYCDSLNENLAEFECPERLTMEELKAEIRFLSPIVFVNLCSLPVALTDAVPDMTEFLTVKFSAESVNERSYYKSVYTGQYFNMNYPQILDAYDKHGVYDYMLKKIREVKSEK